MTNVLRQRGEPYGIEFCDITLLANSRLSLEMAEFARDAGKYDTVHHALFEAYFTERRNIGEMDILLDIAKKQGLDTAELQAALEDGRYTERVKKGSEQARQAGVTAIPTFVIEGALPITGAIDEGLFRKALQAAQDAS